MPVETIKCRECGSAEVTEFKLGSYVCGHCESIFMQVSPTGGVIVGCEIDGCGVPPLGRCNVCGRAFCVTHQARDHGTSGDVLRSYVDLCAACHAAARAATANATLEKANAEFTKRLAEYRENLAAYEQKCGAVIQRLSSIEDPIERLVSTLGNTVEPVRVSRPPGTGAPTNIGPQPDDVMPIAPTVLSAVFPELWPDDPTAEPWNAWRRPPMPWDSNGIARWWATAATKRGMKPNVSFEGGRGVFGPTRKKGWEFTGVGPDSRTVVFPSRLKSLEYQSFNTPMFVDASGERWIYDHHTHGQIPGVGEFAAGSIAYIAGRLGLVQESLRPGARPVEPKPPGTSPAIGLILGG